LFVAQAELEKLEADAAEVAACKDAAVAALDAARSDGNAAMSGYRESRKLSMAARDAVAAGDVEGARAMVAAQVCVSAGVLVGTA
jgi:hypothetical protein